MNGVGSNVIITYKEGEQSKRLTKRKLFPIENTQPFSYKDYVFTMEQTNLPDEMANLLGDRLLNIKGLNDSEVYFWCIMKEISEERGISEA